MPLRKLLNRLKTASQQHYLKLLQSLPEDERAQHIQTQLQASTERVLNRLQKSQKVNRLPETYRRYILEQGPARRRDNQITLAGSSKLGWRLKGGLYEDYPNTSDRSPSDAYALTTKGQFMARLEDRPLSYPRDVFVFFSDMQHSFFFFRTGTQEDDPPVYAYEETNCFYKLADSFSAFLALCAQDETASQTAWEASHQTAWYFDPETENFHSGAQADISSLPEEIQQALRARAAKMIASFQGCSEAELEALRQAQGVDYLPEMYRRVMGVMGKWGISHLLCGIASCSERLAEQRYYLEEFDEEGITYPPDLFIFLGDSQGCGCSFFRTADRNDDPPVYGYWEDGALHKIADSFSSYLTFTLHTIAEEANDREVEIHGTDYRFDPEQNEFVVVPPPPEIRPADELLELMRAACRKEPVGCSEAEIAEVQQAQNVTSLPDIYHRALLLMGKTGLDDALRTYEHVTYKYLKHNKQVFEAKATSQPAFPSDIFVFYNRNDKDFYLFRTIGENNNDPPVYALYAGSLYKFADSLSCYLTQELDSNSYRRTYRGWERRAVEYTYDAEMDDFRTLPLPDDAPSYDKVVEVVTSRWFGAKLAGCTETQIAGLQANQDVDCLPDLYSRLLMMAGQNGLQYILGYHTLYPQLQKIRGDYARQNTAPNTPLPDDIFVFRLGDHATHFYFFRTKDCVDDPAVYFCQASRLYVAADSLTAFALQELDMNRYRKNLRDRQRLQARVRYDPEQDKMVSRTS